MGWTRDVEGRARVNFMEEKAKAFEFIAEVKERNIVIAELYEKLWAGEITPEEFLKQAKK